MSFSKPKIPKPPAQIPQFLGETTAALTRSRIKRRLQGLYGRQSTILTGGSGSGVPSGGGKTLLGT
jgi:hypothetical protein